MQLSQQSSKFRYNMSETFGDRVNPKNFANTEACNGCKLITSTTYRQVCNQRKGDSFCPLKLSHEPCRPAHPSKQKKLCVRWGASTAALLSEENQHKLLTICVRTGHLLVRMIRFLRRSSLRIRLHIDIT